MEQSRGRPSARPEAGGDPVAEPRPDGILWLPFPGQERRGNPRARISPLQPHDPGERLDAHIVLEPQEPVHNLYAVVEVAPPEAVEHGGNLGGIVGQRQG